AGALEQRVVVDVRDRGHRGGGHDAGAVPFEGGGELLGAPVHGGDDGASGQGVGEQGRHVAPVPRQSLARTRRSCPVSSSTAMSEFALRNSEKERKPRAFSLKEGSMRRMWDFTAELCSHSLSPRPPSWRARSSRRVAD